MHDDERLSALLAGRLEGPERDELLAFLSTADEEYEVFADTAAILREMEEEEEAAQAETAGTRANVPHPELVPPTVRKSARRWPTGRTPRRIVMLTVFAGLVAFGTFMFQRRPRAAEGPVQLATRMAGPALPPGQAVPAFGTLVRGRGGEGEDLARAARAGVLAMNLAVAVEARDVESTHLLAGRIKNDYDSRGGSALDSIRAHAGEPASGLRPLLRQATERLEALTDRDALRLGAWTEAALLAAQRRDERFFDHAATGRMLRRAEELESNPSARDAVRQVRAALEGDAGRDWGAAARGFAALRDAITR